MTINDLFYIPTAFETSDLTLWQDPYISSLLLNAHLNPHHDNASRNHQYIQDSTEWILNRITGSKSLLDLGCGPGLYTQTFSEHIDTVYGVDFSKRSIEYAKTQDQKTIYIEANYLELQLEQKFDTVTMIHCEYGSLSPRNRQQLLSNIKASLSKDGLFIFDVFTPEFMKYFEKSQRWSQVQSGFFSDQPYTELTLNKIYDNHISLKQSTIIQDDFVRIFRQWTQYFTLSTITAELEAAGLKLVEHYETLTGKEFIHNSETISMVVTHL